MGIEGPKLVDTIALMQLAFSFATFVFFAAKHQSRVGSFSVERGNAFYTISTFYTDRICVGPRSGCFRAGAETGASNPPRLAWTGLNICFRDAVSGCGAANPPRWSRVEGAANGSETLQSRSDQLCNVCAAFVQKSDSCDTL